MEAAGARSEGRGRRLALREWGESDATRVVFLHGVTGHGGHVRPLAEAIADAHHVVAPDLLGHGDSLHDPPWTFAAQVEAVLETVGTEPATWIGHSLGGRLILEIAASAPEAVERVVLLDPAIGLPPHVALFVAEGARKDRAYATFDEAVELRFQESQLHGASREVVEAALREQLVQEDGVWRYRYVQSAVVSLLAELASPPPPFSAARVPTLLVLPRESYVSYDLYLDAHAEALGDLLRVERVPGGHTMLWDSPAETIAAVSHFLAET